MVKKDNSSHKRIEKMKDIRAYTLVFIILFISSMNPSMSMSDEVARDFSPMLKVYKDGRVERFRGTITVPPSLDPHTGVQSKDVVISHQPANATATAAAAISARLYIPKSTIETNSSSTNNKLKLKLPLLVYFHGGSFCIHSAASPQYHNYLNSLVAKANVVAVSVNYRLAPENPLPIAYDDSWTALKWVGSHSDGNGPEEWLNGYADLERVFFSGDSAGGNIAHNMALRVGLEGLAGVKLIGTVLVHPFFWGTQPLGGAESKRKPRPGDFTDLWSLVCPSSSGSDDPLINPGKDPKLKELGGEKVLVCVAGNDLLRDRGLYYSELLRNNGWKGVLEVMETKGEGHVFHLSKPISKNAVAMLNKIDSFIN